MCLEIAPGWPSRHDSSPPMGASWTRAPLIVSTELGFGKGGAHRTGLVMLASWGRVPWRGSFAELDRGLIEPSWLDASWVGQGLRDSWSYWDITGGFFVRCQWYSWARCGWVCVDLNTGETRPDCTIHLCSSRGEIYAFQDTSGDMDMVGWVSDLNSPRRAWLPLATSIL